MDAPPRRPRYYVGIDVSKARLDVALLPSGESFAVTNDEEGFEELLGRLEVLCPVLVVLEASGGFERPVAAALAASEAGIAICVLNPRQTRDFARATGKLAKTDDPEGELERRRTGSFKVTGQDARRPRQPRQ